MLSAFTMVYRWVRALKIAIREEGFAQIFSAALMLIVVGTLVYTLSEGWSLIDGFYFAMATLTTSSIADPKLTIESGAIKIFTVAYLVVGIGILVEVGRQIGFAFVEVHRQDQAALKARIEAKRHHDEA